MQLLKWKEVGGLLPFPQTISYFSRRNFLFLKTQFLISQDTISYFSRHNFLSFKTSNFIFLQSSTFTLIYYKLFILFVIFLLQFFYGISCLPIKDYCWIHCVCTLLLSSIYRFHSVEIFSLHSKTKIYWATIFSANFILLRLKIDLAWPKMQACTFLIWFLS